MAAIGVEIIGGSNWEKFVPFDADCCLVFSFKTGIHINLLMASSKLGRIYEQ